MADTVKATLGEKPILGSSPVSWTLKYGTTPHEAVFDMSPADARELAESGGPVTLKVESPGHSPLEVRNLWVLNRLPGENPHVDRVRVADRRWMLPYMHFLRRYNMRRNVGFERVGKDDLQPVIQPVVPRVSYWAWSLKTPKGQLPDAKWQPHEVIEDIFLAVETYEAIHAKTALPHVISVNVSNTKLKLSVENLSLDDSGDVCLARALALLPEAALYVDTDGSYVVTSKPDGSDRNALVALGPPVVGGGYSSEVDNKLQRPQYIEIRFSIQSEVRFDLIEAGDGATVTDDFGDFRQLDNVIPVPDFEVNYAGVKYPQSAWLALNKLINSNEWDNVPSMAGGRLTHAVLEKAALPYLDLWAAIVLQGNIGQPDADWSARVGALAEHFRKTFMVNPEWMDRVLDLSAFRVGIVSVATGTNAPAEAYCDHTFIGTQRSMAKNAATGAGILNKYITVFGYPQGAAVGGKSSPPGAKAFTSISKPAPARVSILDRDMGIIRVDFMAEPNHFLEAALPGAVVDKNGDAYVITDDASDPARKNIAFDAVVSRDQIPKLSANWKLAIVLTAVPASPNDERQLYSIKVKPEDIKDLLPEGARIGLGSALGPPWQVRVSSSMDGARALIQWNDKDAIKIEAIFGIGGAADPGEVKAGLDEIVLNANQAAIGRSGVQAASLNEIARSIAAGIYARFADRLVGHMTGDLNPNVRPTGFAGNITHKVLPSGQVATVMTPEEQLPEINFKAFLDNSTRWILERQPVPNR